MLRSIILTLISILCIEGTHSQNTFNSNLLALEKAIFVSKSDSVKNDLISEKIELYFKEKEYSPSLLEEIKRLNFSLIDEKQKERLLWNASLIAFLNKELYYALHYFEKYEEASKDTSIEKNILKILIYSKYDSEITLNSINDLRVSDEKFVCLECLVEISEYELKNKRFKKGISYFLPGMGMLLNGNVLKGSTSLALNTGTFFVIRWMLQQNLYINAVAWGSNLIMKFYLGNVNLTEKLIAKKEKGKQKKLADQCELSIKDILSAYPLRFK